MKDLGSRVKFYRKKLGITQEQLADRMGYKHKSSITKIEKGKHDVPLSKVSELAEALEVTVADLMGWTYEDGED